MSDANYSGESHSTVGGSKRRWMILLALIVLAGVLIGVYVSFLAYVKPNEYGLKQILIGVNRGIQKKIYLTGYHFVLPQPFQRMHRLPRDIQVLELSDSPITRVKLARHEGSAMIQTSDGFFVQVDATILYRIADPYLVFITLGPGKLYEANGIVPRAVPILKQTLGELTTEEFYNSPLRVKKALQARDLLNAELQPKGLEVEHVLIRYFRYSDEIQKNIEEKKLKDQLVFKNQAEARAAAEQAKLKKAIEEGKANVRVKLEEGEAYAVRKTAEQELYARKRRAEGDLLVKLAEAERVALKNQALRGRGSDLMVGLKMAEVYEGMRVVILPSDGELGLNPLDLDGSLRLFGVAP